MELSDLNFVPSNSSTLPKYRQMANCLETWIRDRKFACGSRLPGDRELAEHFGTTPVTISKSLNELCDKGLLKRKVGAGTFVADSAPGQLRRIGIICHEVISMDDIYVTPVLKTFYQYWAQAGYQVVSLMGEPRNYENLIHEYELAGIMVLVPREDYRTALKEMFERGIPMVSIGYAMPEIPEMAFGTNHERISEQAVEYLHCLGHSRIGIIYTSNRSATLIRKRGYENGMWNCRLPMNPAWQINAGGPELEKAIRRLVDQDNLPSAFLIPEQAMVLNIYNIFQKCGLKIPDDISLVAFDNASYLEELNPPLTVFAQRIEEFTTAASQQLEKMIKKEKFGPAGNLYSDALLIERQSCRRISEK